MGPVRDICIYYIYIIYTYYIHSKCWDGKCVLHQPWPRHTWPQSWDHPPWDRPRKGLQRMSPDISKENLENCHIKSLKKLLNRKKVKLSVRIFGNLSIYQLSFSLRVMIVINEKYIEARSCDVKISSSNQTSHRFLRESLKKAHSFFHTITLVGSLWKQNSCNILETCPNCRTARPAGNPIEQIEVYSILHFIESQLWILLQPSDDI